MLLRMNFHMNSNFIFNISFNDFCIVINWCFFYIQSIRSSIDTFKVDPRQMITDLFCPATEQMYRVRDVGTASSRDLVDTMCKETAP